MAQLTNSVRLNRPPLPQPCALSAFSNSLRVMCLPASYSSSQPFLSASMVVKTALWMRVKAFFSPVVDSVTAPASTRTAAGACRPVVPQPANVASSRAAAVAWVKVFTESPP